jgi:predicted RNase H-like HicB family nuclease
MERIIRLKIEKLPEGVYLATSDEIQGLVAQGRTISETIEIARDVAKKLIELQGNEISFQDYTKELEKIELPIVVGL